MICGQREVVLKFNPAYCTCQTYNDYYQLIWYRRQSLPERIRIRSAEALPPTLPRTEPCVSLRRSSDSGHE